MVRAKIAYAALSLIGEPYRWGGNAPGDLGVDHDYKAWAPHERVSGGIDCSGFVLWCWKQAGMIYPDMSAHQLYEKLNPTESPRIGDLAFYGRDGVHATHVVMVLSDEGGVVVGSNGGDRPEIGETFGDYAQRMAEGGAMVKVQSKGHAYRNGFLGFRTPF